MARNPVFLSPSVKFEPISVEFTFLIVIYLGEFLWNTQNEFSHFLLFNLK